MELNRSTPRRFQSKIGCFSPERASRGQGCRRFRWCPSASVCVVVPQLPLPLLLPCGPARATRIGYLCSRAMMRGMRFVVSVQSVSIRFFIRISKMFEPARAAVAVLGKRQAVLSANCFGTTNGTDRTDEKTDCFRARRWDAAHGERYFFGWQLKELQELLSPRLPLPTKEPLLHSGATTPGVY